MNVYPFLNMDDQDQHRKKRLELLINSAPYNGDRTAFIRKAGLTKGRISQLLDPEESFGERAGMGLAVRLGLEPRFFDQGTMIETPAWPFDLLTPDQAKTLPPRLLKIVENLALELLDVAQTRPGSTSSQPHTALAATKGGFAAKHGKPGFLSDGSSAAVQAPKQRSKGGGGRGNAT
ncbi:hypothetical protein J7E62_27520 [Variovorax paradoxus]|nr:hypothetical protein [Variovorax paradoxus]